MELKSGKAARGGSGAGWALSEAGKLESGLDLFAGYAAKRGVTRIGAPDPNVL